MTRSLVLLAAALAVTGTTPGFAQSISVRTLALRPGEMPEVYLQGPDEHVAVGFSAVQPTEPVRAVAANPLPIYRSEMNDKGEQAMVVCQRVKLPAGAKGILLLGWTAGEEMRIVAIEDDFAAARFNDWLLINTGKRPVAFTVGRGTEALVIAPGSSTTHRVSAKKGEGTEVLAQAPFDGKTKTFFSTYWPVHGDRRAVVLFVDDGRKIRVKRISDKLVPAKPRR